MSEIIRTERVEFEEAATRESQISLADLLAGVGWLAYQGTKLAVKGTVAGVKLTTRAIESAQEAAREVNATSSLTVSKAEGIVKAAPDVRSALFELASQPGLMLPTSDGIAWRQRVEALSPASSNDEVLSLASDLIRARQNRLQASTVTLAAEACSVIGFTPSILKGQGGILTAVSSDGGRRISIEVEKGRDGDLSMHFDAHGFRGGECTKALDALQDELRKRGVRFRVDSRQRKDRGPVLDGNRLAHRQSSRGSR